MNQDISGAAEQPAAPETFKFLTKHGHEIVCGKPRGVLKLRMRNILDLDEIKNDSELATIATAVLSIRSINGDAPKCMNRLQFDSLLLNTFADDTEIDRFMNEFQRFQDPEYAQFVEDSLKEALDSGLMDENAIKEFMTKKFLDKQEMDKEKVRL